MPTSTWFIGAGVGALVAIAFMLAHIAGALEGIRRVLVDSLEREEE